MISPRHCRYLLVLALTACCSVQKAPSAPEWMGPGLAYPAVRMCSSFCEELNGKITILRSRLDDSFKACGSDTACKQNVVALGRRAWPIAVTAYSTVNANVPTSDKKRALEQLDAAITPVTGS